MKIAFPSSEFDEAAGAVCHGAADDGQVRALNELLRSDAAARDEYILRLELHSRLASEPDLLAAAAGKMTSPEDLLRPPTRPRKGIRRTGWVLALAACAGLLATGWWVLRLPPANGHQGAASKLFGLPLKSSATEAWRHAQWRAASSRLDEDPSLLVHFDFEPSDTPESRLRNTSGRKEAAFDGAIVGCQWTEGRWPGKHALEFRGANDRVRLNVPGEHESLTLAAWVRVQGLDRPINSLLMSDGFEARTMHWSIRHDGVLGLTAIGSDANRYQICASAPALTSDQLGLWVHLAVVTDGGAKRVVHYLNGVPVGVRVLNIQPPFRIGDAGLGNWDARGFPDDDPFMIRNFSGAMDEFCLFSRALDADEIRALYAAGRPQPESAAEPKTH